MNFSNGSFSFYIDFLLPVIHRFLPEGRCLIGTQEPGFLVGSVLLIFLVFCVVLCPMLTVFVSCLVSIVVCVFVLPHQFSVRFIYTNDDTIFVAKA